MAHWTAVESGLTGRSDAQFGYNSYGVNVSGISILSRKAIVTRRFGSEAWGQLFRDVAASHRCFRSLVTADTMVPLPAFLAFHDELMRRFFRDDEAAHAALGREACRFALSDGPLKKLVEGRDLPRMVQSLPEIHRLYFKETDTWSEAALAGASIEFKVFELPQWHPYLEHFIVGYISEVVETFCANPIRTVRLHGGAGTGYHYQFQGSPSDEAAEPTAPESRRLRSIEAQRHLSHRELEVLLQVANGKTNEAIGLALGISRKTAQHHVARAYRKIGVSGRVAAAVWLAEHGLLGSKAGTRTGVTAA